MNNLIYKRTYLLTLLVAGLTLSACQKDQHDPASGEIAKPVASAPGSQAGGGTPVLEGTGDVGGGNGLDNKVLESYRVNIFETEAYKKILKPKMDLRISSDKAEDKQEEGKEDAFKTWYIAPLKLKRIDNKILGLSFTEDRTQQLAVQTKNEVWINKDTWEKMTLEQQADLLAHEIMMILYMSKFEDEESLCKKSSSPEICAAWFGSASSEHNTEKPRPLNEEDYQNIRSATVWMMSLKDPYTDDEFNKKLYSLGFDSRFFRPKKDEATQEQIKRMTNQRLTFNEILGLIIRNFQKGQFQDQCISSLDGYGSRFPCKFKLKAGDFSSRFTSSPWVKLDSFYQWDLNGPLDIQGFLGFGKNEPSSISYSYNFGDSMVDFVPLLGVSLNENRLNKSPDEKDLDVFAVIRKSISMGQLVIEPVAVVLVEKVYHGKTEISHGDNLKFDCYNSSVTLNSNGQRNYIYMLAKNFQDQPWLGSFLEYGLQDYDCRAAYSGLNK